MSDDNSKLYGQDLPPGVSVGNVEDLTPAAQTLLTPLEKRLVFTLRLAHILLSETLTAPTAQQAGVLDEISKTISIALSPPA